MKTIDIHSHVLPQEWLNILRDKGDTDGVSLVSSSDGKEYISVKKRDRGPKTEQTIPVVPQQYDAGRILADMDKEGIDLRVVSPMQFLFYYWTEPSRGEELARFTNNAMADFARQNPDRLIPAATLPMQDLDRSIRELERIVRELGMSVVEIGTNINGMELDDRRLLNFYQRAQELDVLIFVHPYDVVGIDRMKEYFLRNLAGNPFETALAVVRVIFKGLLEQFPGLKLLFSHGGGAIPYIMGRMDHGYAYRDECRKNINKPPSTYLKSLYFDTITFNTEALQFLIKVVGSDNILLGSDYPFDMMEFSPVSFVKRVDHVSNEGKKKILGLNALRLLNPNSSLED